MKRNAKSKVHNYNNEIRFMREFASTFVQRYRLCAAGTASLLIGLCALLVPAASAQTVPIIFVHGNGDDALRWIPTIWLFESNGYARDRLFAIRFHNPVARTDNTREEAARSSTDEAREELSQYVQSVLKQTHAGKVILVGSSRGGLTIRNYIQNGDGARYVAADVLCGTPNHGVTAIAGNPNGEFNGKGTFLTALNQLSPEGTETVRAVRTMTLRSDSQDKYAQPTGAGLGRPEMQSGVTFEGPALKGAENVVLPGKDHREVAFSDEAFAEMYRFITGRIPKQKHIVPQPEPTVSGLITAFSGTAPTNDPLASVHLQITSLTGDGVQSKVYDTTTTATGAWGPVHLKSNTHYVFDLESDHRHVVYSLAPILRSTTLLNFRFAPVSPDAKGKSGVYVSRPDGYFSRDRDPVMISDVIAADEPAGLPVSDAFVIPIAPQSTPVTIKLRDEVIYVRASPDLTHEFAIAEFLR